MDQARPDRTEQSDYQNLVRLLMGNISPTTRKIVLNKLIEINDRLLFNENHHPLQNRWGFDDDITRFGIMSSRKKEMTEIQHPSFDYFNENTRGGSRGVSPTRGERAAPSLVESRVNYCAHGQTNKMNMSHDIELDDMIDNLYQDSDVLDEKLARIKTLYYKIIADKKQKKRKVNNNEQSVRYTL